MLYHTILLSLNGKDDERKAVDEAMRLKSFFKADLSIVHVNDPGAGKAHMMMDTLPRVTEEDIRDQLRRFGYDEEAATASIILIESEAYADAISQVTRDYDLLVMGHHPKNWLLANLKDSTDERVADKIKCPVLLVPLK